MLLKAVNDLSKYNFPDHLSYDDDFHGTQVGIALCVEDFQTKEVLENNVPYIKQDDETDEQAKENKNKALKEILDNMNILLIEVNGVMDPEKYGDKFLTVYYVPYFVEKHSLHCTSVLFENINTAAPKKEGMYYSVAVEILLVKDNYQRYVTIYGDIVNTSIMNFVSFSIFNDQHTFEQQFGIKTMPDENGKMDTFLDFYDEIGNKEWLKVDQMSLFDSIVATRLISIEEKQDTKE